jgi:hypothetical protein
MRRYKLIEEISKDLLGSNIKTLNTEGNEPKKVVWPQTHTTSPNFRLSLNDLQEKRPSALNMLLA